MGREEGVTVLFVEHLRMMRAAARLDGGQCWVGVLGGGEMLIEDGAACKELRCLGHPCGEAFTYRRP